MEFIPPVGEELPTECTVRKMKKKNPTGLVLSMELNPDPIDNSMDPWGGRFWVYKHIK